MRIEDRWVEDGRYSIHDKRYIPDEHNGNSIILLHGGGTQGSFYAYLAPELCKRGYEVRRVDMPLHGPTKIDENYKPRKKIVFEDMVEAAKLEVEDAYKESKKVGLFCLSMGASIGLEMGNDADSVVVYGTPLMKNTKNYRSTLALMKLLSLFGKEFPVIKLIEKNIDKESCDYVFNVMAKDPNYEIPEFFRVMYPSGFIYSLLRTKTLEPLAEINVPLLFLHGTDDKITKSYVSQVEEIAKENQNITIQEIPGFHIRPCMKEEKELFEFTNILDEWYSKTL